MRILVTNDDGITAPGIEHLARAMEGLGEVVVVAPDREFSGAGAAMSWSRRLHTNPPLTTSDGSEAIASRTACRCSA